MDIETQLQDFKDTFMPKGFNWRKGQKEAISRIIAAYHNKSKVVILDAPVGSGKSIIAMAVSWILNQYGDTGYILASDISLQEQYEKDFKNFNLDWGSVKGIDNYICVDNMEKNSLGTCRVRNKMPKGMYCYNECPYFSARDKASESPTTLLNYAYWLIMQNYVNIGDQHPTLFPARSFTIADEAHKILDIVQNHYSPRFDKHVIKKIEKLTTFFGIYKIEDHALDLQSFRNNYKQLFRTENQDSIFGILQEIELLLENYTDSITKFKDIVKSEYPKSDPPKEWKEALRLSDWLKDFHCKIEDYVYIIEKTSTRNIIKNPGMNDDLVLNCLEESYMMNKYFHAHTGFTVLMSATFADPKSYIKSIALKGATYIKMESNFDFTKSPIYFYNKRRMSYKQIDANLPWLVNKIDEIIDNHPDQNGIIHSASYHLTSKIYENLSVKNRKRVLIYDGTAEKRQVLETMKKDGSKILIGPSLLEGLDLKDEWSRFQIFAKVPYLSLGDKFVKVKLEQDPDWYRWVAIKNILQGVGRSIRNEDDWAITYILDGALADLIHKSRKSFPLEFLQRIQVMPD